MFRLPFHDALTLPFRYFLAYYYTVFPTFLTGLRYHTVTHCGRNRDHDLTSVQRPEMINTKSFGIFTGRSRSRSWTVTFMDGHVHGRSRCGNGAQSKTLEILYKTKRSSRKNKNFSLWYHLWIIFRLSTDWLRFSSKFSKLGDNPLINHMITDRYGSIDLTLYHVTNIEKGFQNFFYRTIKIKFFY